MNGLGTQLNPFLISTPTDLQAINNKLSAYYELTNDIDMTGFNFTPIGRVYPFFQGHLDGKGFVVSNLRITSTINYTGFIARTNGGSIQNIGFDNIYVQSNKDDVGGLIALNSLCDIISNCYVKGTVMQTDTSKSYCGGLIGRNYGNVSNCYSEVTISGGENVGGFSGRIDYANTTIKNCYSNSQVTGINRVGGFSAEYGTGIIYENCYYDSSQTTTTTVDGVEGKTINDLKNQLTYKNWDFKNVWYINTDLPQLRVFGVPAELHKEIIEVISSLSQINSDNSTYKSRNILINNHVSQIYSNLNARRRVLKVFEEYLSSIHSNVTESHLRINKAIRESTSYSKGIFGVINTYYPINNTPIYVRAIINANNSNSVIKCNSSIAKYIINPSKSEVI